MWERFMSDGMLKRNIIITGASGFLGRKETGILTMDHLQLPA